LFRKFDNIIFKKSHRQLTFDDINNLLNLIGLSKMVSYFSEACFVLLYLSSHIQGNVIAEIAVTATSRSGVKPEDAKNDILDTMVTHIKDGKLGSLPASHVVIEGTYVHVLSCKTFY
jgi:hypothetical protein